VKDEGLIPLSLKGEGELVKKEGLAPLLDSPLSLTPLEGELGAKPPDTLLGRLLNDYWIYCHPLVASLQTLNPNS